MGGLGAALAQGRILLLLPLPGGQLQLGQRAQRIMMREVDSDTARQLGVESLAAEDLREVVQLALRVLGERHAARFERGELGVLL